MARRIGLWTILIFGVLAVAPSHAEQTTASGAAAQATSVSAHEEILPAPMATVSPTSKAPATANTTQTSPTPALIPHEDKKRPLEMEADRLVAMATELKARVDKTNKNILSLTVVEQAEQIEHYAHQLKSGDKK
jgi:hypothetical protein